MTAIVFSTEQDQYLQLAQTRAYYKGLREGVSNYAHWRNGVLYVGTTGRTLKEAISEIDHQEETLLKRFQLK